MDLFDFAKNEPNVFIVAFGFGNRRTKVRRYESETSVDGSSDCVNRETEVPMVQLNGYFDFSGIVIVNWGYG